MHACDRQTDGRTDRGTDRITTPKTALAYARAVKRSTSRPKHAFTKHVIFPLLFLFAFTTACTTVQAVIDCKSSTKQDSAVQVLIGIRSPSTSSYTIWRLRVPLYDIPDLTVLEQTPHELRAAPSIAVLNDWYFFKGLFCNAPLMYL